MTDIHQEAQLNFYSELFAYVYENYWPAFGRNAAPIVYDYYAQTNLGKTQHPVLDLCCGTGDLSLYFLQRGVSATGIDLSPHMLNIAREKNIGYIQDQQATFLESDISNFYLPIPVGFATSLYDSINHLPSLEKISLAFKCVYDSLLPEAIFLFDMNTQLGLSQFNGINHIEREEVVMVNRSIYDPDAQHSLMRITGFVQESQDLFWRFEQTLINYVYRMAEIENLLRESGFNEVIFTTINDIYTPIDQPEKEDRVFIIAKK